LKLKKLELYGFKSFADRTVFEFEDSLSALVGPNGSGKSNVADAIKWVLGERSARRLRGTEMINIIFNGSKNRKPLNYAEVTLTIDNADGWLPVEYEEVSIRRRVDRTGQSDYFLNGEQCRLKDIHSLILDTGVGTSCYSFIEQGQIDQLLRASAKERREVFEEAAGINRFLEQKRTAERKLERVRTNLSRVSDIVQEVEHQLRSVKYQAGRARTFKRQTEQLERLRLAHSVHQHRSLLAERQKAVEQLGKAVSEKDELDEAARAAEQQLESARSRLQTAQNELGECRQELTRAEARLESLQREVEINRKRLGELEEQFGEIKQRRRSLQKRLEETETEAADVDERLQAIAAELESRSEEMKKRRERAAVTSSRLQQARQQLEEAKEGVFDLLERESRLKNQTDVIETERRTLRNRLERIRNRRDELERQLANARNNRDGTREQFGSLQAEQETVADRLRELKTDLTEVRAELEELAERELRIRSERSGKMGRRDVLQDMESRAEGMRSGVKRLMEAEPDGLVGPVARLLDAPLEVAGAVDAALGDRAQALAFETAASARMAMRMLADGKGRAELLVLDRVHPPRRCELPQSDGVRGRLCDLVGCDERAQGAVELLLGNVFLVEDADAATALLEAGVPTHVRVVTTDGELYGADGLWAGGESDRPSLISRRSELNALEAEISGLDAGLAELAERKATVQGRARELEGGRDTLSDRLDELRQRAGDMRSRLKVAQSQAENLEQELELSDTERAAVAADLEELDGREGDLRRQIRSAAEEREAAQKDVEQRRREVAELGEQEQELRQEVGQLTTEVARARERRDNLRDLLGRLRSDRRQAQAELENRQAEEQANRRRQQEAEEAARTARAGSEALQKRMGSLRSALEERIEKAGELRRRIDQLAERTRALGEQREQQDGKLQDLRMTENRKAVQIEDLLERTAEDYGVRLKPLVQDPETWRDEPPFLTRRIREWHEPESRPEPVAQWYRDSEQNDKSSEEEQVELISLEEAVGLRKKVLELADNPKTEWDEVRNRIVKLKANVERVGDVNVAAIRQQEELETRLQFLTDQREDLEKAQRHERQIIRELNKTSRERFRQTFDEVRENFRSLFRKLFGGGNADIVLDPEEEDILEAGIDITARPPGKETNTIMLLSGGEKAMTTVALLFAIFQTKPSPFCLLDEVDAPLDDSNVERFLRLLEDFRRDTQFIIITHNKLTMGVAEVLYGITMADGVTRKISVRFEEVEQHPELDTPPRAKAG